MMLKAWRLALILPLACATTPQPTSNTLPVQPQLVPTAVAVSPALQRAELMLKARGFEQPHAVLPVSEETFERAVAFASAALTPDDGMGSQRCTGAVEVVQVAATAMDGGQTRLHLSCHTERLADGPSGPDECVLRLEPGCPEAGDQAVGRLALDAVGL